MGKKRRMFHLLMTASFIAVALICTLAHIDYLMTLVGLVILLMVLAAGNYYFRHRDDKRQHHQPHKSIDIPLVLFFTFLVCELLIMAVMFILGPDSPLIIQKILACLLCVSIFCMLLSGYKFEVNKFQDSKQFSEVRYLGIAINPKHPIGRIIYIAAFVLVFIIFCLIVIFGPTH